MFNNKFIDFIGTLCQIAMTVGFIVIAVGVVMGIVGIVKLLVGAV
ncbi:hypothetical protein AALD01_04640 [Oscillospiraceae bacterium 21-37]